MDIKVILTFLAVIVACFSLRLAHQTHYPTHATTAIANVHEKAELAMMAHDWKDVKKVLILEYKPAVDPNNYRPQSQPSPRILKYLPLLDSEGEMAAYNPDIESVKKAYLTALNYNQTVDMEEARYLARLFQYEQGKKVITYFWGLTQHGLNYYDLCPANFRLWLAIKILADKDIRRYARSVAEDTPLFKDFYLKAWRKKSEEISGIPSPSPQLLKKINNSQNSKPRIMAKSGPTLTSLKIRPQFVPKSSQKTFSQLGNTKPETKTTLVDAVAQKAAYTTHPEAPIAQSPQSHRQIVSTPHGLSAVVHVISGKSINSNLPLPGQ